MGSVQHLKTKFGDGYTLTVKIRDISKQQDLSDVEMSTSDSLTTKKFENHSKINENPAKHRQCKNKYINLILNEMQEKICAKCKLKERHFNNVFQFELPYPQKCKSSSGSSPNSSSNKHQAKLVNVKDDDFCIGDIYRLIELNKLRFNIADYSLSQNTLDNVFINFVKEQTTKKRSPRSTTEHSDDEESDDELLDQSLQPANRSPKSSPQESNIQFPIHDTDLLIDTQDSSVYDPQSGANSNSSRSSSNYATISSASELISERNQSQGCVGTSHKQKPKTARNNLSELFMGATLNLNDGDHVSSLPVKKE